MSGPDAHEHSQAVDAAEDGGMDVRGPLTGEHGAAETRRADSEGVRPEAAGAEPAVVREPGPVQEPVADDVLLHAVEQARSALLEITPEHTVGEPAGHLVEGDRVISLLFTNRLGGYPGWYWTVTLARVEDAPPTVLEAELMPGDEALLAPDWVPWSERLAEYRASQEAAEGEARALAEASAADVDDEADDPDDEDDFGSGSLLHAGDLDGVDVDELDETDDDADDEGDSDDDSDDEDSDDEDDEDDEDSDDDDSDDEDSDDPDDGEDDDERERSY